MPQETRTVGKAGARTAPSLSRTVQAMRTIRGHRARNRPEALIIALRRGQRFA